MNLSTTILGTAAVKQLRATYHAPVLVVGSDRLMRAQLAHVGCYNFAAAKNLSAILKPLGIKSLADLYERLPPGALALPHLGVISLAVLGAAFEVKGIGGQRPLEKWVQKHAGKDEAAAMVTFHTIKRRELAADLKMFAQAHRRHTQIRMAYSRPDRSRAHAHAAHT